MKKALKLLSLTLILALLCTTLAACSISLPSGKKLFTKKNESGITFFEYTYEGIGQLDSKESITIEQKEDGAYLTYENAVYNGEKAVSGAIDNYVLNYIETLYNEQKVYKTNGINKERDVDGGYKITLNIHFADGEEYSFSAHQDIPDKINEFKTEMTNMVYPVIDALIEKYEEENYVRVFSGALLKAYISYNIGDSYYEGDFDFADGQGTARVLVKNGNQEQFFEGACDFSTTLSDSSYADKITELVNLYEMNVWDKEIEENKVFYDDEYFSIDVEFESGELNITGRAKPNAENFDAFRSAYIALLAEINNIVNPPYYYYYY